MVQYACKNKLVSKGGIQMFDSIITQMLANFNPEKVVLFGSQAKGTATEKSDVDICVVMDTNNKRKTICDLYCDIDFDMPIDFLLYTPDEWKACIADETSFAYLINKEGIDILNGQYEI